MECVGESVREGCVHVHGGAQPDGHPTLVSLAHQHSSSSSSSLSPNQSFSTSAPPLNLRAASQGKVWKSEAALVRWPSPVNIHFKWEPLVELQLIYWSNYRIILISSICHYHFKFFNSTSSHVFTANAQQFQMLVAVLLHGQIINMSLKAPHQHRPLLQRPALVFDCPQLSHDFLLPASPSPARGRGEGFGSFAGFVSLVLCAKMTRGYREWFANCSCVIMEWFLDEQTMLYLSCCETWLPAVHGILSRPHITLYPSNPTQCQQVWTVR